jgi:competence protein ComEC
LAKQPARAAQLGVWPLVAYYYHTVSLISPLANILIVPLLALVIGLGFSAAVLGVLLPGPALGLYRLLDGLLAYITTIVQTCSLVPYGALSIASPSEALICGYYALLWSAAAYWGGKMGKKGRAAIPAKVIG